MESMFARLEAAKGKPEAGGDRADLRLLPHDEALIHALTAVNARTVVALQSAGAVLTRPWDDGPAGIVLMWYAGMEGGHALADLLKGDVDFSGRLPFAMVADPDDLPATIPVSLRPLARWSQTERAFVLPPGDVRIEVSRHWGDPQSVSTTITL